MLKKTGCPKKIEPLSQQRLVINRRIQIDMRELKFTFVRSSGPGGQNVNKVNTKAVLRWPVEATESLPEDVRERFISAYRRRLNDQGQLVVSSQRYRDQRRNVNDCLEKLRAMVARVAKPPRIRKKTRPTAAAVARRLEQKQKQSQKKQARKFRAESE